MLSLDEQVPQMLRNAASIGIDLQPAIDRGIVRLYYDPPQEIEVDHHFHKIERIVEEFKPQARRDRQPVHLRLRASARRAACSATSSMRWSR